MSVIRECFNWFTGKSGKEQMKHLKKVLPKAPPPEIEIKTIQDLKVATQIKTFQEVRVFCREIRKTLRIYKNSCQKMLDISWIHKKAIDSLHTEMGNLSDKIDRLLDPLEREDKTNEHSAKR